MTFVLSSVNCLLVRSLSDISVQIPPFETKTVIGKVRNVCNMSEAVTENIDNNVSVSVCPNLVHVKPSISFCRIPVTMCNMSAHPVVIKPNSLLCRLQDIEVVGRIDPFEGSTAQKNNADKSLSDPTPFKDHYRRIPPGMYVEVREHLKDMLAAGAVRECNSPFSSNVVLVRKKDGPLRFCIDYRRLNNRTIKDAYALPRIDETIDSLVCAKFFSKLNFRSFYWQVAMKEADKYKTAFSVGPLGF
jgi:hypothetical protein